MLELDNVTKSYPAGAGEHLAVLKGVSLSLDAGRAVAVQGPSGSGKSTLLHIAGALDRPTSGSVRLDGRDLAGLSDRALTRLRAERIGFVFQAHHLLPHLTLWENVLVPALARGRPDEPTRERAAALLERVGLAPRRDHRPGALSGGECQRAALVRALVNRPALLLADEPTGALDRAGADALGDLLVQLHRDEGVAMVVVTHSDALAARIGRVLELKDGRLHERA